MKTVELTPKEFYEFKQLWATYYGSFVYHMIVLKGSVFIEADISKLAKLGF
jgi:hypothetical protein